MGANDHSKRKRAPLRRALSSLIGSPRVEGEGSVEIRGRGSVTVHGSGTILTYTPGVICLQFGRGVLRIEGEALVCSSYFLGAVRVDGKIHGLAFEEDDR